MFLAILLSHPDYFLLKAISGPVPAGTVDAKMFKAKPVTDGHTEKKKYFSIG